MAKPLICPKCGHDTITVQLMQGKTITKTKGTPGAVSSARKMMNVATLGIWGKMTGQKAAKSKSTAKTQKIALCQSCGHDWKVR